MSDFEKMTRLQPVEGGQEAKEFKERLSFDYENIRKDAMAIIDQKILLMKDELGPGVPKIALYEAAKDKLNNDQYVIDFARNNNWEKLRGETEDINETDKNLAKALVNSVLDLQ